MMAMPPLGVCLPARWTRTIDGDTIELTLRTTQTVKVRLVNCDAPEAGTIAGDAATARLRQVQNRVDGELVRLWIPLPNDKDGNGVVDLDELFRAVLSFERVVGRVFVGTGVDLSDVVVGRRTI